MLCFMSRLAVLIDRLFRSLFALPVPPSTSRSPLKNYDRATIYSGRPLPQGTILDLSQPLYAGTEDVADDGEHGYRRIERTYAPLQGRRGAIWLYASTEDIADYGEHGYRRTERTYAPW